MCTYTGSRIINHNAALNPKLSIVIRLPLNSYIAKRELKIYA